MVKIKSRFIIRQIELIDGSGKFSVEPTKAAGHSAVSLKLNSKNLDYENPNERKFLLLIVATETDTPEKLSSTATVTVEVTGEFLMSTGQCYKHC